MGEHLEGFVHRFVPAKSEAHRVTLLLLHGTGGDESDLLALGQMLVPGAALLSPRGKVDEGGAPRFFRRLAEGVFDLDDLHARTQELAAFVTTALHRYRLDDTCVVAVGFSNGANIAGSLLLSRPDVLDLAVLFRAMVPFEPERPVRLDGKAVLLGAGRVDPLVPAHQTERLAAILTAAGADVSLAWQPGGHGLTKGDIDAATQWLRPRVLDTEVG